MPTSRDPRPPAPEEYDPFYQGYVSRVPTGDIVQTLERQADDFLLRLGRVPEERETFRYAPGKWTVKEIAGHVIDAEWVFTYRALRFARGDRAPLVGLDQDEFMAGANFDQRRLGDLLEEFEHLRGASQALFRSFDDALLDRRGRASDCDFSVRSMLYVIAGHADHHLDVLERLYAV